MNLRQARLVTGSRSVRQHSASALLRGLPHALRSRQQQRHVLARESRDLPRGSVRNRTGSPSLPLPLRRLKSPSFHPKTVKEAFYLPYGSQRGILFTLRQSKRHSIHPKAVTRLRPRIARSSSRLSVNPPRVSFYTLHPTPCTLHPTANTLHLTP